MVPYSGGVSLHRMAAWAEPPRERRSGGTCGQGELVNNGHIDYGISANLLGELKSIGRPLKRAQGKIAEKDCELMAFGCGELDANGSLMSSAETTSCTGSNLRGK